MLRPLEKLSNRRLCLVILIMIAALTAIKLFLATQLELYSDEIFYWQASTRPALAYSDLPFMTALLAGVGTWLGGNSALAVRTLFLLLGASLPLLLYWVALPLAGTRRALESAALGLCLPLIAFMGLLAVPDVPLLFLGLLLIGLFERATRLDRASLWLTTGVVTALGLSTHYRFILFPVAMVTFLVASPGHRQLWRTPRLWAAITIAAIGFFPALAFNLRSDLSGLDYHFLDRHPWQFQTEGLLHPLVQATVVTPLLYAVLIATLVLLIHGWRKGNDRMGLFALFAIFHLGVFLILAPWADNTRTNLHWPLAGYLPLLVHAPWTMRQLRPWLGQYMSRRTARRLLLAVPATGLLGGLIALAGIGSQGFNQPLQQWLGTGVLSNKMAGWKPLNRHLQQLMEERELDGDTLVVTNNYYTGAQIAFYTAPEGGVFNMDRDKAVRDGRLAQYRAWGLNTDGISRHGGSPALFITEDSTLNIDQKLTVMERACRLFDGLDRIDQLSLYGGDKRFSFYRGRVSADPEARDSDHTCPLPSYVWLDNPADGETVRGPVTLAGWAFNEGPGIRRVKLMIDGRHHATLERDVPRPDVVEAMDVSSDPNMPRLGFEYRLNSLALVDGRHTLALEVISNDGEHQTFATREIVVRNAR